MQSSRILFVLDTLKAGGTERQALLLAEALSKRGWEVRILCLDPETPLMNSRPAPPFSVIHLGFGTLVARWLRFMARLHEFSPDIVQSHSSRPHAFCIAAKFTGARFDWVVAVRDALPPFHFKSSRFLVTDMLLFRSPLGIPRFLSNSRRALTAKGVEGTVIPNLLDPAFRGRTESARVAARQTLQIEEGTFAIGLACNTTPYKGLEFLVEAASSLAIENLAFVVVLAGEVRGPCGHQLVRDAAAALGSRFRFLGLRDDLPRILPAFDVFCSSAITESSSNSVAEAMACGLPCVVTDVGDSAELVGDSGWVVPPASAQRLADALKEAASAGAGNLTQKGERAKKRIEFLRDFETIVTDHETYYRALAADRPNRGPNLA